jgi:hypothetical protein
MVILMMERAFILKTIKRVRRRLRLQNIIRMATKLLLLSLAVCLPPFILDSLTGFDLPPSTPLLISLFGLTLGVLLGGLRKVPLLHAARRIDVRANLKDRTVSALEFITRGPKEPLTELQIKDTFRNLRDISPKRIAPFSMPREVKFCVILAAMLLVLSHVELFRPEAESVEVDTTPQITVEAARILRESLLMKEKAKKEEDQDLEKLAKELERKAYELNRPDISRKEAILKLSELSKTIRKEMDRAQIAKVESLLRELARQFALNPLLSELGYLLKRGEFESSARKVERLAEKLKKLNEEQRQNLAYELKRSRESLAGTALASLGDDLGAAGESLEGGDLEGAGRSLRSAGQKLRLLGRRKSRYLQLAKLLQQLTMGKIAIAKGEPGKLMDLSSLLAQMMGNAGMGGVCQGKGIGQGGGMKSDSPSNSAGTATDQNIFGEATSLEANRQLQQVKGEEGEGVSFSEVLKVVEEGQRSSVGYRKVYSKYSKLSEEALSREEIPLGYRYYVKRYFEMIRPEE